ncbi:SDR family oxidoreductase [Lysinibacillus xylanilyticus]|nr:SDR family oxidoreductase [Lysinibacillus xylanilyticus]
MNSSVPIKRTTTPIEIAEIITFLSSDASNYIPGGIINVSGGRYFKVGIL